MSRENYGESPFRDQRDQNNDEAKINEVRIEVNESIEETIQNAQLMMTPLKRPSNAIQVKKERVGFQAYGEEVQLRRSNNCSFSIFGLNVSNDEASNSEKEEEMYFSEEIDYLNDVKASKQSQKAEKKERKKQSYQKESKQQREKESNQKSEHHKSSGRKVRKTITPALLKQLNKLFKEYEPDKKCTLSAFEGPAYLFSLKSIGQHLNLGYSTILHKYRQFRAHNEVRGGALIASINNKRKYNKSIKLEQHIEDALQKRSFCTAVELCHYLQKTHSIKLSRSIISRHLVSMGYSFKYSGKNSKEDYEQIREIRFEYLALISSMVKTKKSKVHYLSECEFSIASSQQDYSGKKAEARSAGKGHQSYFVIAMASFSGGISHFDIQRSNYTGAQFRNFLNEIITQWQEHNTEDSHIVIMDLKPNHRSHQMLQFREQIRSKNIMLIYLPPFSQKLNFADHIFSKIGRSLKPFKAENFLHAEEMLEQYLMEFADRPLLAQAEEIKGDLIRAANKQPLSSDE